MNPPAIVIRVPFEGAPIVYVDALHEGEEVRLEEWLETHPAYGELVDEAVRLAEEARTA